MGMRRLVLILFLAISFFDCNAQLKRLLINRSQGLYAYAWSPSYTGPSYVLSVSNTTATGSVPARCGLATPGFNSGMVYFEIFVHGAANVFAIPGIAQLSVDLTNYCGSSSQTAVNSYGYYSHTGNLYTAGSGNASFGASTWDGADHTIGIAINFSTGNAWFALDNTWQGSGSPDPVGGSNPAITGLSGTWYPCWSYHAANAASSYSVIHANASSLTYTPPAGYSAPYP